MTADSEEANYTPHDQPCRLCGELTWRQDLGAKDRIWHDGFVCNPCWSKIRKQWIGLISPDGKKELNARFVLGDERAESLKVGQTVDLLGHDGKTKKWRISHAL